VTSEAGARGHSKINVRVRLWESRSRPTLVNIFEICLVFGPGHASKHVFSILYIGPGCPGTVAGCCDNGDCYVGKCYCYEGYTGRDCKPAVPSTPPIIEKGQGDARRS
jgi:hypothetical protein